MGITQSLTSTQQELANLATQFRLVSNEVDRLRGRLDAAESYLTMYSHLNPADYQHPECWTPVVTDEEDSEEAFKVQRWLRETMPGRYDVCYNWAGITVFFENISDAVAFKLRWGGL